MADQGDGGAAEMVFGAKTGVKIRYKIATTSLENYAQTKPTLIN